MTDRDRTGILRGAEGYPIKIEGGDRSIVLVLAAEEKIEFRADYGIAIDFRPDNFNEHRIGCDNRQLLVQLADSCQRNRKQASKMTFERCPLAYVKQTRRIADLKPPRLEHRPAHA